MMSILRGFVKSIPTLILSMLLAVAVWISAVNASDPIKRDVFPRSISIEKVGQDAALVAANDLPDAANVTISAPSTVWERLVNEKNPLRAWIDLTGLTAGKHNVEVHCQPQVNQPVKVVKCSPQTIAVTLEKLETKEFDVRLIRRGEPATGFQADEATLGQKKATISGPASQVDKVKDVIVAIDVTKLSDNISQTARVQAVDANSAPVSGVTISPEQVSITQPISQRFGYRDVVVKVTYTGQLSSGYRLTNISSFPRTVTVYSSDPNLVERLPGYVETSPVDLNGAKDDLNVRLSLNLPNGVEVEGDSTVSVQVGVAAIEGSVTLSGLGIQVTGLASNLSAKISPETVDVIISGPVPLLDHLVQGDVKVYLDLTGVGAGTYQFAPKVTISIPELQVESILPGSIEVVVQPRETATPTPRVTITPTPTVRK